MLQTTISLSKGGFMGKFIRMAVPNVLAVMCVMFLILAATTTLQAAVVFTVPEIDPTSAIAPAALLAGAVLVIRGRIKR